MVACQIHFSVRHKLSTHQQYKQCCLEQLPFFPHFMYGEGHNPVEKAFSNYWDLWNNHGIKSSRPAPMF